MVEVLAEMCGSGVGRRAQRGWSVLECGVLSTSTHQPQHQPLTAHFPPPPPLRCSRAKAARLKQHIRRLILLREAAARWSRLIGSSAQPSACFLPPGRLQYLQVPAALCARQGWEEDSTNRIIFLLHPAQRRWQQGPGQAGAEGLRLPIKCFHLPGCAFHSLVLELRGHQF